MAWSIAPCGLCHYPSHTAKVGWERQVKRNGLIPISKLDRVIEVRSMTDLNQLGKGQQMWNNSLWDAGHQAKKDSDSQKTTTNKMSPGVALGRNFCSMEQEGKSQAHFSRWAEEAEIQESKAAGKHRGVDKPWNIPWCYSKQKWKISYCMIPSVSVSRTNKTQACWYRFKQ